MKEESLLDKLFTPFYERVKNPFLGSFLISWLVVNWKIIYVTFFIEKSELTLLSQDPKIDTKIEYIQQLVTWENFFCWPLLGSIIYISIIQLIAVGFSWLIEWFRQWQLANKIKVIKNSPRVSGEMYVDLLNELEEEKKKLPEYTNRIAEADNKRIEAEKKVTEYENQIKLFDKEVREKQQELEHYRKLYKAEEAKNINSYILRIRGRLINLVASLIEGYKLNNNTNNFITIISQNIGLQIRPDEKIQNIRSDNSTIFLGSPQNQDIESNFAENITLNQVWIAISNKFFDRLNNSTWITYKNKSNTKYLGDFIFIKSIVVSQIDNINNITINVIADNSVKVSINNLSPIASKDYNIDDITNIIPIQIVKYQIKDHFVEGINFIIFNVRRNPSINESTKDIACGLIFNIRVEMD